MNQKIEISLSQEEADRLLNLCLCSPASLDDASQQAMLKLANGLRQLPHSA